jgi:hypothetical protein
MNWLETDESRHLANGHVWALIRYILRHSSAFHRTAQKGRAAAEGKVTAVMPLEDRTVPPFATPPMMGSGHPVVGDRLR